jgi:hypothetical protein
MRLQSLGKGFQDMRIDKMVGLRASSTNHVAVQGKGRLVIGPRSIGSNHGSIKIDIGRVEMIEDEASVRKVGKRKSAEADQLEGVELGLAMA